MWISVRLCRSQKNADGVQRMMFFLPFLMARRASFLCFSVMELVRIATDVCFLIDSSTLLIRVRISGKIRHCCPSIFSSHRARDGHEATRCGQEVGCEGGV